MTVGPLSDWFHQAALAVGFVAHAEGWLGDSDRVKRAVYALYETGEWPAEAAAPAGVTTPPGPAKRLTNTNETETL